MWRAVIDKCVTVVIEIVIVTELLLKKVYILPDTQGQISSFTLELLSCLYLFFIHLKLELLTQFPASNDEKNLLFMEIRHLSN